MSGFVPISRFSSHIGITTKQFRSLPHNAIPIAISYNFRNGFSFPIILVCKNGIKFRIPGDTNYAKVNKDFCVDVSYTINEGVKIDDDSILDVLDDNSSEDLKIFKAALAENDRFVGTNKHFVISYSVNINDFMRADKSMTIEELDIVIAAEDKSRYAVHPQSHAAEIMQATQLSDQLSFFYQIAINDPNKHFGERYVNVAGRVFKCLTTHHLTNPPGVYLYSNNAMDNQQQNGAVFSEYYTFEEATEKLALYRTVDEAKTLGDPLEGLKRDHAMAVQKLKNDNLELQAELDRQKNALDRQILANKSEADSRNSEYQLMIAKLKEKEHAMDEEKRAREAEWAKEKTRLESELAARKHEMEMKSLRSRDVYDERSYARKDSSELLKYVMGLGLLVYAIKK